MDVPMHRIKDNRITPTIPDLIHNFICPTHRDITIWVFIYKNYYLKNERRRGDLNSRGVTTSGFRDHRLPGLDYLGTGA